MKLVIKMDYKVLYRKYRPIDFSNIIGQEYMIKVLKNAISHEKISHAYIFSGPRGTGKTSTAKVFAKAINCLNPGENGPCNECDSCKHFKENADIIEIDAASNNGVDEIREIINNIKLAPAYSKYKVYIVDEVHMLSTSAFNALLLTLEEPPKHVVFILATTNIEAVPITILSRCQRFDFKKISLENIISRLKYVTTSENIDITAEALEEIAYISDGGMRDALSILDQLSGKNSAVTIEDVTEHFGSVSKKQISNLFQTLIENNVDKFHEMMNKFKTIAIDYKVLIKKMLEKIEEEAITSKKNPNYQGLSYQILKDMAFELAGISNYVSININPYTLIEIALLKYFKNHEATPPSENINNNSNQSQKIAEIKVQKPISTSKEAENMLELKRIRINNCFVNAKKDYLQATKEMWINFISDLEEKILLNLIIDSNIAAASDKYIILISPVIGTVNLINKKISNIAEKFNQKYNQDYKFIALTNEEWHQERNNYINNIKNKITYEYIEEPAENIEKPQFNENDIENVALNIFAKETIEIE